MAYLLFILAIVLAFVAYKCYDKADKIETGYSDSSAISKNIDSHQHDNPQQPIKQTKGPEKTEPSDKIEDDSLIGVIERYNSWKDYQAKHPLRAKEIKSLGIDLSSKIDSDASEWIYAIETTARDSNCKISELKRKYFDVIEQHNPTDADWIYVINGLAEASKRESQKYNLKIGNTAADVMLLFVLDKIKEIEARYASSKSDPLTLKMRFLLDSDNDVLMLQKLHIYLCKYPMTERSREYRENWHKQIMTLIEKRIAPYEKLKEQALVYNMAVSTEIFKLIHDEILKEVPQNLLDEFNSHLLSFHEEMEIISEKAVKKYKI